MAEDVHGELETDIRAQPARAQLWKTRVEAHECVLVPAVLP